MRFGFPLCLNTGRAPAAAAGATTYRYFKLHVTATADGTGTSVAEFSAALTSAGANQFSGKTASATSSFDGTTLPAKAVDDNVSTLWASDFVSLPQDLIVDNGTAITPFEFRVTVRSGSSTQYPQNFTISGGNDGATYPTTFVTRTGETWTDNETKTYTV